MNVYAEHILDGKEYRKKTLLCFGKGIELIGSAVLINPGSAKPESELDTDIVRKFYQENHTEDIETSHWKKFSSDSTMQQLEKIFNGWYVGENKELNGVIQLFNLHYYMHPNVNEALNNINEKYIFNEEKYFLDKPVYFGWGNDGKTKQRLKEISEIIFDEYDFEKYTPGVYDNKF